MTAPHLRIRRIVESDLPPRLRHLLHALAYHCDSKDRCYPSYAAMAAELGVSRDAVRRRMRELIAREIVSRAPRRPYQSNLYILHWTLVRGVQQRTPPGAAAHPRTYQEPAQAQRTPDHRSLCACGNRLGDGDYCIPCRKYRESTPGIQRVLPTHHNPTLGA